MERIKLTMAQAEHLEEFLENVEYNKDALMQYHEEKKKNGLEWIGFKELNSLTVEDMRKALYEGYNIKGENTHLYKDDYKDDYKKFRNLMKLQNAYQKPKNYESSLEELQLDIDYHLDGLGLAVKEENDQEIEYHKKQLKKLVEETERKK